MCVCCDCVYFLWTTGHLQIRLHQRWWLQFPDDFVKCGRVILGNEKTKLVHRCDFLFTYTFGLWFVFMCKWADWSKSHSGQKHAPECCNPVMTHGLFSHIILTCVFWSEHFSSTSLESTAYLSAPKTEALLLWPSCWKKVKRKENLPTGINKLLHYCCWMFSLSWLQWSNLKEKGQSQRSNANRTDTELLKLNNSWLTELSWPWKIPSVGLLKPGTAHLEQRGQAETGRWKHTCVQTTCVISIFGKPFFFPFHSLMQVVFLTLCSHVKL